MSDKSSSSSSSGIGFCGLLTVAFVVLKLTEYIDWDWDWVLAPMWIPLVIALGVGVVFLFIFLLAAIFDKD